jgi:hypothetical protein
VTSDVIRTRAGFSRIVESRTVRRAARRTAIRTRIRECGNFIRAAVSSRAVARGRALAMSVLQGGAVAGAGFTLNVTVGLIASALALVYVEWRRDHV